MLFLKVMWHILYLKAISMNEGDACSSRLSKTTHIVNTKSSSTFQEYSDGN